MQWLIWTDASYNEVVNACMQTAERSHYHAFRKRCSIFESAKFPPHWLDGGP